jgi:hypothetical protein
MRRLWLWLALTPGLMCLSIPTVYGQDIMERLPAETAVCVRINGLDQSLNKLDQFLMGATPIPLSLGMMAKTQLGGMLGNFQLQGVNTQGTLAIVALMGAQGPSVGILVPVSDFQAFTGGSSNITALEEDGIFQMAAPKGQKLLVMDAGGGYALMTPARQSDQLKALKQQLGGQGTTLGAGLDAAQKMSADTQPLWFFINTAMLGQMAAPMVKGAMQQGQAMLGAMGQGAGTDPAAMAAAGDAAEQFCNRLARETKYATLTLAPDAQALGLNVQLQSVPGSDLAKSLTRSTARRDTGMLGYLQDDAVFNLSGNLMSRMPTSSFDSLGQVFPAADQEKIARLKTLFTEMRQQFKGTGALSVKMTPQKPPFVSAQYVTQVADAARLSTQIGTLVELLQGILPADGPKLSMNRDVQTHKNVKVDALQWTLPENQGPVESIDYRVACVGNFMAMSVGSDVETGIQALIDKTQAAPAQAPQEVQSMLAGASQAQQADVVATLNLQRLVQQIPQQGGQAAAMPTMPSQSGMVAQLTLDKGIADFGLTLPKAHLQEITQALQMMMMQRMMQQQQQN